MNRSQAEEHVSHDPPCCLDVDSQQAALLATDPPYLVDYQGGNHPQSWANNPHKKDKHWDDYRDPDAARAFFADFLKVWLPHCVEGVPLLALLVDLPDRRGVRRRLLGGAVALRPHSFNTLLGCACWASMTRRAHPSPEARKGIR